MRVQVLAVAIMSMFLALSWFAIPAAGDHLPAEELSWACGLPFDHPGPDSCLIYALPEDEVVVNQTVWIPDSALVIGILVGGEARAYPVKMFNEHEIANDVVPDGAGGLMPIAVTYCPLCGSGAVFDRRVTLSSEAVTLEFEVSGWLYKHDLVMYDRDTGLLFAQIGGAAVGTFADETRSIDHPDLRLIPIPNVMTTWGEWAAAHPGSLLMQRDPYYFYDEVYGIYPEDCYWGVSGIRQCELEGLGAKEIVYGVTYQDEHLVATLEQVRVRGLLSFRLGDATVVIFQGDDGGIRARDVTRLGLNLADGGTWFLGEMPFLEMAGLIDLHGSSMYWFAWAEHHPGTVQWNESLAVYDDRGSPGIPEWIGPVTLTGVVVTGALIMVVVGIGLVRTIRERRLRHGPNNK